MAPCACRVREVRTGALANIYENSSGGLGGLTVGEWWRASGRMRGLKGATLALRCATALACVSLPANTAARACADPALTAFIAKIRSVDNHSHAIEKEIRGPVIVAWGSWRATHCTGTFSSSAVGVHGLMPRASCSLPTTETKSWPLF